MRAAVLYDNKVIKTEEVKEKQVEQDEVRVKVMSAGICGSDTHKMQAVWKYPLPAVMGHEFSGVISEIGENVSDHKVGDRVAIAPLIPCRKCEFCQKGEFSLCEDYTMIGSHRYGGFAENVVVPSANAISIDGLSFEEGAMIEPLAVAMHAVRGIEPELGDTVIVFGIGTIGLLVVQALQVAGVKNVIAVDISSKKLEEAKTYGIRYTINSLEEDLEEKVSEYTNGLGADIALECAGSKITQEQCLRVTSKHGKIGYIGIAYQDVTLPEKSFENIFRRELTIKGFWNSYSAPFPGKEWSDGIEFVKQGRIKLKPMVSHRYSLDQTKEAFDMMLDRKEDFNKVIIQPNGEE
ncbi:MAG: galactitol-1-phosphate 5-dehydrogenase [Carnobacterium inhibens]